MIFSALFRPRREMQADFDFSPYFARESGLKATSRSVSRRAFTGRLTGWCCASRGDCAALQAGSVHAYLLYMFLTLFFLLFGCADHDRVRDACSNCVLLLALAPLVTAVIRHWKAKLQKRRGPAPLQPYFDLAKSCAKVMVIPSSFLDLFRRALRLVSHAVARRA